jgi:hypothetical protein
MDTHETKINDMQKLLSSTNDIMASIEMLYVDLKKSKSGNQRAARRARVLLIELEKKGKKFRKLSVKS